MVATPGRTWRAYAGPVALLVAATVAVAIVRDELRHRGTSGPAPAHVARRPGHVSHKPVYYVVRAGDTLDAIAAKLKVPVKRLLRLNPKLSPTALFIGEKIRLR